MNNFPQFRLVKAVHRVGVFVGAAKFAARNPQHNHELEGNSASSSCSLTWEAQANRCGTIYAYQEIIHNIKKPHVYRSKLIYE